VDFLPGMWSSKTFLDPEDSLALALMPR